MGDMMRNWWTTSIGAILAGLYYLQGTGAKVPETRQEWLNVLVGVGIAMLGYVSKDATTGSSPK